MPLETTVVRAAPAGHQTPLLAIAVARGALPASLAELDGRRAARLQRLAGAGDFTGKRDETALVYPPGPAGRILLVGMGKVDELNRTAVRRAAAVAAKRMRALGVAHGAFHLPAESRGSVAPTDAGQAIAEGLAQGAWQFLEMKRPAEDKKAALERVDILAPEDHDAVAGGPSHGGGSRRRADARPRHPGAAGQHLHADLRRDAPRRSSPRGTASR